MQHKTINRFLEEISGLSPWATIGMLVILAFFSASGSQAAERNVRVGVYPNEPKVFMNARNEADGFWVDLTKHIGNKENWRLEFVPGTWPQCLERLEQGKIDLLVDIAYSEERTERFDFNRENVLSNWATLYVPEESEIQSILDLRGKRIAVLKGDISYQEFRQIVSRFGIRCEFEEMDDFLSVLHSVHLKAVDAGLVSRLFGYRHEDDYNIRRSTVICCPRELHFATAKGKNGDLLSALDAHMKKLKQEPHGPYHRAVRKWIGSASGEGMPKHAVYVVLGLLGVILVTGFLVFVLRSQVRARTRELFLKNKELQGEILTRKNTENALRESEERYALVLKGANEGLWDWNIRTGDVYFSKRWKQILGYEEDEIPNRFDEWERRIHPEDKGRALRVVDEHLEGKTDFFELEHRLRHKNGSYRWILARGICIRDEEGRPVRMAGAHHDVTSRKKTEEELLESKRQFQALAESTTAVILIGRHNGSQNTELVYANPAAVEKMGRSLEELKAGGFMESLHPDSLAMMERFSRGQEKGIPWPERYEMKVLSRDGAVHWVESTSAIYALDGVEYWISTSFDITERKKMEEALRESEDKYRALFENAQVAMFRLRMGDGKVLEANEVMARQFGYDSREDFVAEYVMLDNWVVPSERDRMYELAKENKGHIDNFEAQFYVRDGSPKWFRFSMRIFPEYEYMDGVGLEIDTEKRTARALEESEKRFRTLTESTSASIHIHRAGKIIYANRALLELTGYSVEELNELKAENVIHPDSMKDVQRIADALETGKPQSEKVEMRIFTKSGESRWIEITTGVFDLEGELTGIQTAFDITERKAAEVALRRREAVLKSLAYISERLIDSRDWREEVQEILRRIGEELQVDRVHVLQVEGSRPEDRHISVQEEWTAAGIDRISADPNMKGITIADTGLTRFAEMLDEGKVISGPTKALAEELREYIDPRKVLSVAVVPVFNGDDWWGALSFEDCSEERKWSEAEIDVLKAAAGIFGSAVRRQHTEKALAESEDIYRTIFETTGTGTVIFMEDGVISLANEEFSELTGFARSEIENVMHWKEFLKGRRLEDEHAAPMDVPKDDGNRFEARLTDKSGTEHEGVVVVNRVPGTTLHVASFFDLTDLKQAEMQMFRADKMAALGQIIAGVAHEINNPNNFIYFNLPILKRYIEAVRPLLDRCAEDDPDLRILNMPYRVFLEDTDKLIENMQHGSERITGIVSELKNYIRSHEVEDRKPESLDLVIQHVMALVGKQVRKMVKRFDVEVEKDLPLVPMNAGKIEQVLINLVINAGQSANKENSRVSLSAFRDRDGDPFVHLVVEDNGSGVPRNLLSKIFDPFFTTKGRDSGTGLGLAISQRIVEEHGGKIRVESREGQGTRFTIRLPIA